MQELITWYETVARPVILDCIDDPDCDRLVDELTEQIQAAAKRYGYTLSAGKFIPIA